MTFSVDLILFKGGGYMLEAKIRRRAYEIWAQFRWLVEYEDLVQEGWLGATVGSGRYKEGRGTSLENWCFVYADGGMRNYIRREVGVLRDRDEFKGEDRVGDGVEGIELMESVWSGLRRLGIGDFEILWQYYFEGMSLRELGERYGRSHKAMGDRLRKAEDRFRDKWEGRVVE